MAQDPVEAVRRTARELENTREILEQRIRRAHERGASLRTLAEAAGVSHEQVRRIVSR